MLDNCVLLQYTGITIVEVQQSEAGLQGLIDSGSWQTGADLAEAFLNWGQYAYGAHAAGTRPALRSSKRGASPAKA